MLIRRISPMRFYLAAILAVSFAGLAQAEVIDFNDISLAPGKVSLAADGKTETGKFLNGPAAHTMPGQDPFWRSHARRHICFRLARRAVEQLLRPRF